MCLEVQACEEPRTNVHGWVPRSALLAQRTRRQHARVQPSTARAGAGGREPGAHSNTRVGGCSRAGSRRRAAGSCPLNPTRACSPDVASASPACQLRQPHVPLPPAGTNVAPGRMGGLVTGVLGSAAAPGAAVGPRAGAGAAAAPACCSERSAACAGATGRRGCGRGWGAGVKYRTAHAARCRSTASPPPLPAAAAPALARPPTQPPACCRAPRCSIGDLPSSTTPFRAHPAAQADPRAAGSRRGDRERCQEQHQRQQAGHACQSSGDARSAGDRTPCNAAVLHPPSPAPTWLFAAQPRQPSSGAAQSIRRDPEVARPGIRA